jgi:acyl-CoA reductase-like NAD-dependent aldehyde dehydrogenase
MGAPWQLSVMVQAGLPVIDFASIEDVIDEVEWERRTGNSLLVRQPVGVVGCITPWNYPLHQISAKVAAAFAAGCTVVLKPSELVPGVAYLLAEVMDSVGLRRRLQPRARHRSGRRRGDREARAGRHGVVHRLDPRRPSRRGAGRRGAQAHVARAGRQERLGAARRPVRRRDGQRVAGSLTGCLINSGQTCSATTRLLVPRDRLPEVEGLLEVFAQFAPVGDPMSPDTQQGPLVSKVQQERVRSYISTHRRGRQARRRRPEQPEATPTGFFVKPTGARREAGTTSSRRRSSDRS